MLTSALLILASACAPQASPSRDGLAAVRAVFQRTEGATRAPEDVLARRLVALGTGAAPVLFELASGAGLEPLLGELPDESWLCPPDQMPAIALAALGELPEVPVRELLRARCSAQRERETRVTALRVLAEQGTAGGLALYLELLDECGAELAHPSVRVPAVAGLRRLLVQDRQTLRQLEEPLAAASAPLGLVLCEALAASPDGDAVRLLTQLFGRTPELDLAALEALAALGERYPWSAGATVSKRLLAALGQEESDLRATAARALGRTRDPAAVPALIECLTVPSLERTAEWALREITAQPGLAGAEAWRAWSAAESAWWRGEGERALAQLQPRSGGSIAAALRTLMAHPAGRDRTARALGPVLGELEPELAVLACQVLARLQARLAVPDLVALLSSSDARVREAAGAALRQLTGATLPAEPRLWEEHVAGA
ncbi:MAG TPA: HEAT repeat domain-containing protein [Planctomycetota bacterium]